ncbi:MAG TPA: hypothetical protein PKY81_15035 [bacterium]|nr:hypothetical protein [bacterium]
MANETITDLDKLRKLAQQPLWDRQQVQTATSVLKFFSKPADGSTKTDLDTNIKRDGGMLEDKQAYLVKGIRALLNSSITDADAKAVMENGLFVFKRSDNEEFRLPLILIPAACGIHSMSTFASVSAVTNGLPHIDNMYKLANMIEIPPNQSFSAEVQFFGSKTISGTAYLTIVLEGFMKKNAMNV